MAGYVFWYRLFRLTGVIGQNQENLNRNSGCKQANPAVTGANRLNPIFGTGSAFVPVIPEGELLRRDSDKVSPYD